MTAPLPITLSASGLVINEQGSNVVLAAELLEAALGCALSPGPELEHPTERNVARYRLLVHIRKNLFNLLLRLRNCEPESYISQPSAGFAAGNCRRRSTGYRGLPASSSHRWSYTSFSKLRGHVAKLVR